MSTRGKLESLGMVHRVSVLIVLLASLAPGLLWASTPADDTPPRLRVCLISGAEEYESDRTLASFQHYLETRYPVTCTLLKARGTNDLPGLEALENTDVALLFTRRLTLPPEQIERIKRYIHAGKPLVAVRTASHAFQNWLELDAEVLGGSYKGHLRNDLSQRTAMAPNAAGHPVLQGVGTLASRGSLYRTSPISNHCTLLLNSTSPEATEPAAWVRTDRDGRIFYTSLGAQQDFENASFLRLLTNALFWTARRDIPAEPVLAEQPPLRARPEATLTLNLRKRVETAPGSGEWRVETVRQTVPAAEVGVVICDMWDLHWCRGATERADAIAGRMNPVIDHLRKAGVQIVHAPSDTMAFYAGTPQRLRAKLAPTATPPPAPELPKVPPLPIDESDGGCDTDDPNYLAWTRQNPKLTVAELDAVSENGDEIYNLFRQQGIKYVLMMGVHTNMCVLNRTFAIKAMTKRGMHAVLVRDLTDAMYDPKDTPKVTHDEGTNLVIEHIEKYWCPSVLSTELVTPAP